MRLTSAGAAGTVTGSCHLIEIGKRRIVLDCGMFQGPPERELLNREPFPFEPSSLDAVVLSHGHLDHVGRLPVLVQRGYSGPIHCTPATAEIVRIILRDSAHIQEEDWDRAVRKARRTGDENEVPPPLYGEEEARIMRLRRVFMGVFNLGFLSGFLLKNQLLRANCVRFG